MTELDTITITNKEGKAFMELVDNSSKLLQSNLPPDVLLDRLERQMIGIGMIVASLKSKMLVILFRIIEPRGLWRWHKIADPADTTHKIRQFQTFDAYASWMLSNIETVGERTIGNYKALFDRLEAFHLPSQMIVDLMDRPSQTQNALSVFQKDVNAFTHPTVGSAVANELGLSLDERNVMSPEQMAEEWLKRTVLNAPGDTESVVKRVKNSGLWDVKYYFKDKEIVFEGQDPNGPGRSKLTFVLEPGAALHPEMKKWMEKNIRRKK